MDINYEKVCLITGAGAIENAWKPIIRILEPDYKFVFDIDSSNFFLALMVYQLRAIALDENSHSQQHLELMLKDYYLIKSELCRSLIYAEKHKEIIVRNQFFSILDKYVFQKHIQSVQITTNWDTVIDNAVNNYGHSTADGSIGKLETFHLHGSVLSSKTLYLPSEIAKEPYRSKEESIEMMKNHSSVFKAVFESNRTILYGLSLDPLDAELSQILALGWDSINTKEIVVINPDYKKVVKRVQLLLNDDKNNINVTAYLPDDLEREVPV
ncbi:MAG: hypothetical protein NVSMB45_19120 [Ginsengibacter sp.]